MQFCPGSARPRIGRHAIPSRARRRAGGARQVRVRLDADGMLWAALPAPRLMALVPAVEVCRHTRALTRAHSYTHCAPYGHIYSHSPKGLKCARAPLAHLSVRIPCACICASPEDVRACGHACAYRARAVAQGAHARAGERSRGEALRVIVCACVARACRVRVRACVRACVSE